MSMVHGYSTSTLGLSGLLVLIWKFCGKQPGSTHQMPSVSSSSVLPGEG